MDAVQRKQILDNLIEEHNAHIEAAKELRERILALRKIINEELYGKSIGFARDMPKPITDGPVIGTRFDRPSKCTCLIPHEFLEDEQACISRTNPYGI